MSSLGLRIQHLEDRVERLETRLNETTVAKAPSEVLVLRIPQPNPKKHTRCSVPDPRQLPLFPGDEDVQ